MSHISSSSSADIHVCMEHQGSEIISDPVCGRRFQRSACLGHSQKGCVSYSGIDLDSGKMVHITEWLIKHSQIKKKEISEETIIAEVEQKMSNLSKLQHKTLIGYECAMFIKRFNELQIFLVQEFLFGANVKKLTEGLKGNAESVVMITKGVLDSLIFLNSNGFVHGSLSDSTVFIDSANQIKITNFCIAPYLQEILGTNSALNDLQAFKVLVESLTDLRAFPSKETISDLVFSEKLSEVPILVPEKLLSADKSMTNAQKNENLKVDINFIDFTDFDSRRQNDSRLQKEFEKINFIGEGSYGQVLKVIHKLDHRCYAIKCIDLPDETEIGKKMTQEAKLLSRLNHENVVRYFASWIETEVRVESRNFEGEDSEIYSSEESSSYIVKSSHNYDDDSDDGIEFAYPSDNASEHVESSEGGDKQIEKRHKGESAMKKMLYIQMEFCDKLTLRTAIDDNLYRDDERLWRLFREILEGMSHIHAQGICHRDLKPDNIFLDSKGNVKIGDFGLAAIVIDLHYQMDLSNQTRTSQKVGISQASFVGTPLYAAPELRGKNYDPKVDLYSLGIIFFEMCSPPFSTQSERIINITSLREAKFELLEEMDKNKSNLIKQLLDKDPKNRPSVEKVLQSGLLPPAKVEANELYEMLRDVFANRQSTAYRQLISRCLDQEMDSQFYYHENTFVKSSLFENVKNQTVQILRKHGAVTVSSPILAPFSKRETPDSAVKLMCHSGSAVTLPYDLRKSFWRYVATNGSKCSFLRRYSIERVYNENETYGCYPKQSFICAFDVVTPKRGKSLLDAEVISVAFEIINSFGTLSHRSFWYRINHTDLLCAILMHYLVPKESYKYLLALVAEYLDGKISKHNVKDRIQEVLPNMDEMVDLLLISDSPIDVVINTIGKINLKDRTEALAKGAIKELQRVISLSEALGVRIHMNVCIGLCADRDMLKSGSIIWKMMGELNSRKPELFASGGRFDKSIEDFQ